MASSRNKSLFPIRNVIVIAFLLATLGALGVLAYEKSKPSNTAGQPIDTTNKNPLTEQEKQQAAAEKNQSAEKGAGANASVTPVPVKLAAVINRAIQMSAGQPVNIRGTISGTSVGTCELKFVKTGQTAFSKSFPIVMDATSATCGQADVPSGEFPASGEWEVQLVAKNGATASAAAKSTVQVSK